MSKHKARREIPRFNHPIIETHCHLDYLEAEELERTLAQSAEVGIERIITIAVSPGNLDTVLALANSHPVIWGTQGIHPHEAESYTPAVDACIRSRMSDARILAVAQSRRESDRLRFQHRRHHDPQCH